jgi:2-haloacid dehalogenase
MVTLTNSPPNPRGPSPLEHAGLAHFFERQFSVDTVRAYKPAPQAYHLVDQSLGVPPSACFMVAAHVWDTAGAQSAGYTAGLITRPGNAPLPVTALPQPDLVASDLPGMATRLIERRR